jgi:DNA-binding GntR family transcriptional regulator
MATVSTSLATEAPALGLTRVASLAEQAADVIVTGISAGALKPGERLYETELARRLNMSRVPLREALKILEAQGIVESTPHRGTRVALFGEEKVIQICEARIALERLALNGAAPRFATDPGLAQGLDMIIGRMERAAQELDWIEVSRADLDFHREICRISANEVVSKLWESLARQVFIVFGHEIRDERDAAIIGPQHKVLRGLLIAGDVDALFNEIERHIMRLRNKSRK